MQIMTEISGRGAAILNALRVKGDWMNRSELAIATGKRTLSPNDRHWLETLDRGGQIEIRRQPIKSPLGYEWQYRVKS